MYRDGIGEAAVKVGRVRDDEVDAEKRKALLMSRTRGDVSDSDVLHAGIMCNFALARRSDCQ